MKRKRGRKPSSKNGGRPAPVTEQPASPVSSSIDDNHSSNEIDDSRHHSEMDNKQSLVQKQSTLSTVDSILHNPRTTNVVYSRVKVKLKSSKLESHQPTLDAKASTCDDINKTTKPAENNVVAVQKVVGCSDGQASEIRSSDAEKLPRKLASIRIKSSRAFGNSNEVSHDKSGNTAEDLMETSHKCEGVVVEEKKQSETKVAHDGASDAKQELNAALTVIKKVMKMEAAAPFNTPVDPVALDVPDYFDIIDTPMDFGTICNNIESSQKYMNSEDVFKDVQFVWENCIKYNNKGDYIMELMKRVKKAFMKYWLAAGLYSNALDVGATESGQMEDDRSFGKAKRLKVKLKHKRRRHG